MKLHNNKLSVEDNLTRGVVKTTIQALKNEGIYDNYNYGNAKSVKNQLLLERRRLDSEELNEDNVIQ